MTSAKHTKKTPTISGAQRANLLYSQTALIRKGSRSISTSGRLTPSKESSHNYVGQDVNERAKRERKKREVTWLKLKKRRDLPRKDHKITAINDHDTQSDLIGAKPSRCDSLTSIKIKVRSHLTV